MKKDRSVSVATADGSAGAKKLGHPGPRLELRLGIEELGTASGTAIRAGPMLVPELSGERAFGALLAKDAVLLVRQFGPPLAVGLDRRECLGVSHEQRICLDDGELMTPAIPAGLIGEPTQLNTMERSCRPSDTSIAHCDRGILATVEQVDASRQAGPVARIPMVLES